MRRSSITPGRGEQQDSPRAEYYAIQRHRTIRAKAIFRDGMSDRGHFSDLSGRADEVRSL
jgi:hypothetical protein